MKWVTLLLQLISFRSSLLESRQMIENAKAMGEKGRRAAIFSGICLLALVYFLAGSILLVVEIGMQFDRAEAFRFSGLFFSALFLVLLAGAIVGVGAYFLQGAKAPPPPPPKPEGDVKAALEGFLVTFLSQLGRKLGEPGRGEGPRR